MHNAERRDGSPWDAESVLAASNIWTWVPQDARHVETDEYILVAAPEYSFKPTTVRVLGSDRDPAALADEICGQALDWGRHRLWWRVSDGTRPAGLEAEVAGRGGMVTHRMDVLALPLCGDGPDLVVPAEVIVRRMADEDSVRDAYVVIDDAFETRQEPTQEQIDADLEELRAGLEDDSVGRVVAYVDGRPAGTGGWTLAGEVCRLWGGGTHGDLRGRGVYRAVLQERLRIARRAGATLALTHGVIDTSAPILTRIGFRRYGEERELVLDLS